MLGSYAAADELWITWRIKDKGSERFIFQAYLQKEPRNVRSCFSLCICGRLSAFNQTALDAGFVGVQGASSLTEARSGFPASAGEPYERAGRP